MIRPTARNCYSGSLNLSCVFSGLPLEQVAIFSTSFCRSSKNAFWLIARNLARVGAVTVVTDFVVFIMKLVS